MSRYIATITVLLAVLPSFAAAGLTPTNPTEFKTAPVVLNYDDFVMTLTGFEQGSAGICNSAHGNGRGNGQGNGPSKAVDKLLTAGCVVSKWALTPKNGSAQIVPWTVKNIAVDGRSGGRKLLQTCQILNLDLGPLDLNLLGLVVQLDEVNLDIIANPAGGLLGQLLCGLAGLLDGGILGGLLGSILTFLTNILNNLPLPGAG